MGEAADQGRHLEQQVAAFFRRNGYTTRCNEALTGRSGGRHEVDVLAEKSDALTTFRVAVECKAWQRPIEKDVISKLHYVMGDLGINKGIVVSLAGCRSGAQRTATDLGIELWGPDELRRHFGDANLSALVAPGASAANVMTGWGYIPTVTVAQAEPIIRSMGGGRLRRRTREELVQLGALWLPAYVVAVTTARYDTHRRQPQLRSSTTHNLYDALGGTYLGSPLAPWQPVVVEQRLVLPVQVRDTKLVATLSKAFDSYHRVTSPAAVDRHATTLAGLGIVAPCASLTLGNPSTVFLPIVAGLLEVPGHQRVVAVQATNGTPNQLISALLTSHLPVTLARLTGLSQG